MCRYRAKASCAAAAIALAAGVGISGCRGEGQALDVEARTFVRLAVALGEHDPDSLDFFAGSADVAASVRQRLPALAEIRDQAAASAERVAARRDAATAARRARLAENLRAIAARVDVLRGARPRYAKEVEMLFGVRLVGADPRRLAALRARIADLLPGDGRLADRYSAFAAQFIVPADRLSAVMQAAVDECRQRTLAYIALPDGERVTLELVHDRPWSAYSRYQGSGQSVIQVNADYRFTLDQALQIACHEGYPGHHTRNVLNDSPEDPTARWPERAVQLTFSPAAMIAEASAMAGVDTAFPDKDRVRVERDRLRPIAGLGDVDVERHVAIERLVAALQDGQATIAEAYLDGRLEFERAVDALEQQTLVPRAEPLVKYINEYRSYVSAYTDAARLFSARLSSCSDGSSEPRVRWDCFRVQMMKPSLAASN